MIPSPATPFTSRRFRKIATVTAGAGAVSAALFGIGFRGPTDPLALSIIVALAAVIFALALMRAQLVLLWLVPLSMTFFVYSPVLHYEALVLLFAGLMAISAWHSLTADRFVLESIEWRYGLLLLTLLPGISGATSLWRFFGTFKIFVVGFLGFEIARRGARRFGREAMLWGPGLFCLITAAMLATRAAELGLPGFKSVLLRTYITQLSWGTSNYVAAVLVLCMPSLVFVILESPSGTLRRFLATGVLVAVLGTLLLTSSRGGFLISLAYLLTLSVRMRRSLGVFVVAAASFVVAVLATPFGRGSLARFTNAQNLDSVIYRGRIWMAAWDRGIHHLPFGVGMGQGLLQQDKLQWMDPHNFLLTLFSESGPMALAAWLFVLFTLWRLGGRLGSQPEDQPAGHALRATLVIAFFNCLFEPTLAGNLYFLLFWWIVGILEASRSTSTREPLPARAAS